MVLLSKPVDQSRLNATIHELIGLRFNGSVYVQGRWDPNDTLDYLEARRGLKHSIPTMCADGSLFKLEDKYVAFTKECVIVSDQLKDVFCSPLDTSCYDE